MTLNLFKVFDHVNWVPKYSPKNLHTSPKIIHEKQNSIHHLL
jgi:hypothetical protein